ncbi:MAG: hypothetical protein K2K82_01525 [Muribaculaceae bacterium]|nr:hypothetical protein [Muribaculaceae bacterium]
MDDKYFDKLIRRAEKERWEAQCPSDDFFLSIATDAMHRRRRVFSPFRLVAGLALGLITVGCLFLLWPTRKSAEVSSYNFTYVETVKTSEERIERFEESNAELRASIDRILPFPETVAQ